ncbi:hypothetical protein BOTNAR_0078g00080 [Botryotinia narcissicola]|uniref:Uncharacterized protein n=1 Tax=Botryotinia narcissicola TaxID=278944 RepID=A0A4Z1J170_9HELO|nr:hypothetical protein BOTNAR_0078g00080 [Botryotinia narcissicola]
MSFNPTSLIRSALPNFLHTLVASVASAAPRLANRLVSSMSQRHLSSISINSPDRSLLRKRLNWLQWFIRIINMMPLYTSKASPPRRFVVPDTVVTNATPMASLLPPHQALKNGSTEITTLQPPKDFAGEVTNPTSQAHSTLRAQAPIAITLTSPYDFYYPSQPPTPFPLTLDPKLFITLQSHNYPELILPQLRDLILNIDTNLPAFQAQVGSTFTTADTREERYFTVKPEPELKMILRIFDEWYTDMFPRRAACLIYPDDFEHQPAGEMDTEELACRFPDPDKGGVDMDTGLLRWFIDRDGVGRRSMLSLLLLRGMWEYSIQSITSELDICEF